MTRQLCLSGYPTIDEHDTGPQEIAPADWRDHTMNRGRLTRYLEIKVHHLVQTQDWRRLRVIGRYAPQATASLLEKRDKMFNWQRPTATPCGSELVINCFPGRDYVYHYGLILATFLALRRRMGTEVVVELPEVTASLEELRSLEVDLPAGCTVVVGWGLPTLAGTEGWRVRRGYAWKTVLVVGRVVCYLGFFHSIWGDVAGRVVERLHAAGAAAVIYVGKVGALDPSCPPNEHLASGTSSILGSRTVTWPDYFGDRPQASGGPVALGGVHVTSPSVLLETKTWLEKHRHHQFVDPEIGHMGLAAQTSGIRFGYLHIISNNLARCYRADLSNEREGDVLARRNRLLRCIGTAIAGSLTQGMEVRDV